METNIYLFSILLYHFLSQIEHLFVSNLCNILFIMDKVLLYYHLKVSYFQTSSNYIHNMF